jgi:hypothetical protein
MSTRNVTPYMTLIIGVSGYAVCVKALVRNDQKLLPLTLAEAGLITADAAIATAVHQIQLVDGELAHAEHDFSVDFAITPSQVVPAAPDRQAPPRPA